MELHHELGLKHEEGEIIQQRIRERKWKNELEYLFYTHKCKCVSLCVISPIYRTKWGSLGGEVVTTKLYTH